ASIPTVRVECIRGGTMDFLFTWHARPSERVFSDVAASARVWCVVHLLALAATKNRRVIAADVRKLGHKNRAASLVTSAATSPRGLQLRRSPARRDAPSPALARGLSAPARNQAESSGRARIARGPPAPVRVRAMRY